MQISSIWLVAITELFRPSRPDFIETLLSANLLQSCIQIVPAF